MIGGLISTGIGLAGTVYSGIQAGKQRKEMENYLTGQESRAESEFNSQYYTDYTQRTDTLAAIQRMRDELSRRTQTAQSTAAITGATPEAVLAEKEQAGKAISDTMTNVAAMGQQYKDRILDSYQQRKDRFAGQRYAEMEAGAQSYENLMGAALSTMGRGISSISNSLLPADKATKKDVGPLKEQVEETKKLTFV